MYQLTLMYRLLITPGAKRWSYERATSWEKDMAWTYFTGCEGVRTNKDGIQGGIERTSDRKGQKFLVPEIEVEAYWTSLSDEPETIIELYHAHGTSEQVHSELKSAIDVERLPSGKFLTNSLVLKSAMLAFNVLRKMGCDLLSVPGNIPVKLDVMRRRIKSVIQNLVNVAGKLVRAGGRAILKISRWCPWFDPFERLFSTYYC